MTGADPTPPVALPPRRRGVTLRFALGGMIVLAVALGAWTQYRRSVRSGIDLVRRHNGMYHFDFEMKPDFTWPDPPVSWAPRWLRKWLGDEMLHNVTWLRIEGPEFNDDDLRRTLARFPKVVTLGIVGTKITDKGLAAFRGNRHLRGLFLADNRITDVGIDTLRIDSIPRLELLDIRGTKVSDAKADEVQKNFLKPREDLARANRTAGSHVNSHFVLKGFYGIDLGQKPTSRDVYERKVAAGPEPAKSADPGRRMPPRPSEPSAP